MSWIAEEFTEYRVLGQNTLYGYLHAFNHSANRVAYRIAWLPSLKEKDSYSLLVEFHDSTFQLAVQKL